jgi:hypothetical protein
MNGLEAGIHALREIGHKEEAQHLLNIARELGKRRRAHKEHEQGERDRQRGNEREEAMHKLRIQIEELQARIKRAREETERSRRRK